MVVRAITAILFACLMPGTFSRAEASKTVEGIASVYGFPGDKHAGGTQTANGEVMNPDGLTAAHRTLPFGSRVRVTHRVNGLSVVVRINDRGPFIAGRVIDLSPRAAAALGFSGLAPVMIERVDEDERLVRN